MEAYPKMFGFLQLKRAIRTPSLSTQDSSRARYLWTNQTRFRNFNVLSIKLGSRTRKCGHRKLWFTISSSQKILKIQRSLSCLLPPWSLTVCLAWRTPKYHVMSFHQNHASLKNKTQLNKRKGVIRLHSPLHMFFDSHAWRAIPLSSFS